MHEIERELALENRDKKRIAASAYKRVGASKKCTLPYENMDAKARREYMKPSEVVTFKLSPMPLSVFRKQGADKQLELLKWYGEKYGWSASGVALALDCSRATAYKILDEFMLDKMFELNCSKMTVEQKRIARINRNVLKDAVKPQSELSEERHESIPRAEEKPATATQKASVELFSVTMDKNEFGATLERRLEGIAHSLDLGEVYAVKLSIVQLSSANKSEGDVVNA